ncbi:MAG: OmpA family protein [Pseudomonadota bacterium]
MYRSLSCLALAGLIVVGDAAIAPVPATAQTASDQETLQRQRELLIQRRQQQGGTRTLLEINPQTGNVEDQAPAAGAGQGTVVSTTPEGPSGGGGGSATRIEAATAPLDLSPEDQLFRPIKFAYDSAFLDNTARGILNGLCETLKQDLSINPGAQYFVIGHTDAAGGDAYNLALSERRAAATKAYLVDDCGIAASQLEAVGMGEQRLLASFRPRAANQRRVEIQVRLGDG